MSLRLIARKDLEDVVRSRILWAILLVFGGLVAIIAAGAGSGENGDPVEVFSMFVNLAAALLLPLTAIFIGYLSITGERESGSLRVLFGLSHDRGDVLAGKLVSRLSVMIAVAVFICVLAAGVIIALFDSFPTMEFAWFSLLTVMLAVVLITVAVSISAMSGTRYRSMGGAIGGYVLAVMFWYPAVAGLYYVLEGGRPGHQVPEWYLVLQYLNPIEAYRQAVMLITESNSWLLVGWENIVEDIPAEATETNDWLVASNRVSGDLPVYLSEWGALGVLVFWTVIPIAIAWWSFHRADLN